MNTDRGLSLKVWASVILLMAGLVWFSYSAAWVVAHGGLPTCGTPRAAHSALCRHSNAPDWSYLPWR